MPFNKPKLQATPSPSTPSPSILSKRSSQLFGSLKSQAELQARSLTKATGSALRKMMLKQTEETVHTAHAGDESVGSVTVDSTPQTPIHATTATSTWSEKKVMAAGAAIAARGYSLMGGKEKRPATVHIRTAEGETFNILDTDAFGEASVTDKHTKIPGVVKLNKKTPAVSGAEQLKAAIAPAKADLGLKMEGPTHSTPNKDPFGTESHKDVVNTTSFLSSLDISTDSSFRLDTDIDTTEWDLSKIATMSQWDLGIFSDASPSNTSSASVSKHGWTRPPVPPRKTEAPPPLEAPRAARHDSLIDAYDSMRIKHSLAVKPSQVSASAPTDSGLVNPATFENRRASIAAKLGDTLDRQRATDTEAPSKRFTVFEDDTTAASKVPRPSVLQPRAEPARKVLAPKNNNSRTAEPSTIAGPQRTVARAIPVSTAGVARGTGLREINQANKENEVK